jgi:hypothetical protein
MNKTIKVIILGIVILCVLIASLMLIKVGMERQQKHECLTWIAESKEYPEYFFTDWQIEQCFPETLPETNIPYRNDAQKFNNY